MVALPFHCPFEKAVKSHGKQMITDLRFGSRNPLDLRFGSRNPLEVVIVRCRCCYSSANWCNTSRICHFAGCDTVTNITDSDCLGRNVNMRSGCVFAVDNHLISLRGDICRVALSVVFRVTSDCPFTTCIE
jgi:hypothetical protein